MRILITGGSGFIGRALCRELLIDGHELILLTRQPDVLRARYVNNERVQIITRFSELSCETVLDAVINLAGEGIADKPWSAARKLALNSSRIDLTHELVAFLAQLTQPPRVMISGSAIGFYADAGDTALDESSPTGPDFMQRLCADWEASAASAKGLGIRLCILRLGVVLGPGGGMMKRLKLPFSLGLGGRLGDGQQWLSWVALVDVLALIRALLADESKSGAFNVTAPEPVTNAAFTEALGRALKRPTLLPVPAFLLKAGLGEMSALLLGSQRVLPKRLLAAGFRFRAATIDEALRRALSDEAA